MPNEPVNPDGRRTSGRTLPSELLWAVAGAALFLGVGASLPLWTVRTPAYVVFYGNPPPPEPKGSLWAAASVTLDERRYFRGLGADVPLVQLDDDFVRDALLLLGAGAVAGLGSYFACPGLRQQKGGGP